MPIRKIWDHAINIKKGFMLKKEKVYLLSREEREEVHEFILEQLRKGYIKPSKSPQTALVFFVGKKNKKKYMVQDYKYLNEQIVKNIDNKKVFMKMNLKWGYNNICIKKGDE